MLSPWLMDALVYSGLAAFAAFPMLTTLLKGIRLPVLPVLPAPAPAPDRWQAGTVDALVTLQGELEQRKMPAAMKLCRELIWEILGGDAK